jgi:glutamine---fructose-6-phosphate transaminase (isomerizing)
MCGILGFHLESEQHVQAKFVNDLVRKLYLLSESRGKEASGIALQVGDWNASERSPQPASQLIRTKSFRQTLDKGLKEIAAKRSENRALQFLGHSRLVTNGKETTDSNNQPVDRSNTVGVHNGIIVNVDEIWKTHPHLTQRTELDSESFFALVEDGVQQQKEIIDVLPESFGKIEGMASIAGFVKKDGSYYIATNNGSIYYINASFQGERAVVFASESFIIGEIEKQMKPVLKDWQMEVRQLQAGEALVVHRDHSVKIVDVPQPKKGERGRRVVTEFDFSNRYKKFDIRIPELRRCSRCVLPETHPFIRFDDQGVCNFCLAYKKVLKEDSKSLEEIADRYRSKDGSPDCVVAFSGGRDSCYGLHYLKQELNMNPVAFTYDWGMVTDLARRNQSRLCGRLGVEHIMISADIRKKRENIRKNINAWLRKPDLGMIPLFMAGDKQFFQYANLLKKRMGIDLVVFASCPLETTQFKIGFTGIGDKGGEFYYKWGPWQKTKIGLYYASQYLSNPGYINGSLYDSVDAFLSYFFIEHNYMWLFESINWKEETVERVLLEEYDWETSPDCDSTWRIGDGTAAFYNYIYYRVAGFTENDTFRSNQIREGQITRERALELIQKDNQPRIDSLQWYADTVGFDLDHAIDVINKIPRLY